MRRPSELIASAAIAIRAAAAPHAASFEDVALWCAEFGAVDPRLQVAALRQAYEVVVREALIADLIASLRARLLVAGPYLAVLSSRGDLPRLLVALGLDDAAPPDGALARALPPRIARFYWQRLRAFVAWTAARNWTT
ncbi:MAG TPA: hypothetical protein VL463_30560 [Kofleriaceae bacterium]|nr:hypothetical protein [Kofleriaceae bacterium]